MTLLMTRQLPETHEGKCVIACVSKKIKYVSIANVFGQSGCISHYIKRFDKRKNITTRLILQY